MYAGTVCKNCTHRPMLYIYHIINTENGLIPGAQVRAALKTIETSYCGMLLIHTYACTTVADGWTTADM